MKSTPIVFASDANFIEQLRTASFSAVYACRSEGPGLDIHILDCGIDDKDWQEFDKNLSAFAIKFHVDVSLTRHDIDMSLFVNYPAWTNGSKATWARVLLPNILQDVDSCVYSDCDVLILENPCEIVDALNRSGALMVGHRNPFGENSPDGKWFLANDIPFDGSNYLCAGFIGLNLNKLRSMQFIDSVFSFLRKHPNPATNDQTVLNWFCFGHTSLLDPGWGIFPHECMSYDGELKALHLSGGYPWSRVKNAYDWVGRHCSQTETKLYNAFRVRIMKAHPITAPSCKLKYAIVGWLILQVTRLLNLLHIPLPGHPCFSELVAQFDGDGLALQREMKCFL